MPKTKSIKTARLRVAAGRVGNKLLECYIPRTLASGHTVLPARNSSILRIKMSGESFGKRVTRGYLRKGARADMISVLCTYLGVSRKMANVIASRPISDFHRIEEQINGFVDNFLLAYPSWFCDNRRKEVFHIVRICYTCGAFNLDSTTKWWKQLTNYLWIKATLSETIEEPVVSRDNPFRRFLNSDPLRRIIRDGIRDKRDLEHLIHFVSSRQLVAGSRKTQTQAIAKFQKTTSSEFPISDDELKRVRWSAKHVGSKCLRLMNGVLPKSSAHISLSTAGDLHTSVKAGGRCTEIMETIKPILTKLGESDREYETPWGQILKEESGIPLWRTWCRDKRLDTPYEFGEVMEGNPAYWNDDRRAGFDDVIGAQIYTIARFKSYEWGFGRIPDPPPIPCRTLTVPEPGGKARIVTTTLWWVIVLQQPSGHFFKDCLLAHPSAEAGLQRADQAWLYIDLLAAADFGSLEEPVWFLSSDLQEATDAIPTSVARQLAEGYAEGLGVLFHKQLRLSIDLLCHTRIVEYPDGSTTLKLRGILMGEPLTKALLSLLSLCCEEAAIRDYLGVADGPVNAPWRCFAVGGDDHIAGGPKGYINNITSNHIKWGSMISKEKHATTRVAVRYCEKALLFRNTDWKIKAWQVNKSTDLYDRSIFVDSIKVRLLSTVSKSIEIENDRNIAIGKAKSFGRTLRWLNPDRFPSDWVHMVRDRFWRRMRDYLPPMESSLGAQLLLPEAFGGLDLYLKGELQDVYNRCPIPTKQYLYKLVNGLATHKLKVRFRRFCSNDRMRGQDFQSYFRMACDEYDFEELGPIVALPSLQPLSLFEARDKYNISKELPLRKVCTILTQKGILYTEQIIERALRPTLFNEMLAGAASGVKWNTTPWKKRYAQLWDDVYDPSLVDYDLQDLELLEKPEVFLPLVFYDVNTRDEEDEPSFIELLEDGLPNLRLPYWECL